nr:hypothetical protein [Actibacterium sp. 188UL27-1]
MSVWFRRWLNLSVSVLIVVHEAVIDMVGAGAACLIYRSKGV